MNPSSRIFSHSSYLSLGLVVAKLILLFLLFYLDLNETLILGLGFLILISVFYEAIAQAVVQKYNWPGWIYSAVGIADAMVSLEILRQGGLLQSDLYLLIIVVVMLTGLRAGAVGGSVAGLVAGVEYVFLVPDLLPVQDAVVRGMLFILSGMFVGYLSNFTQIYYHRWQKLKEMITHNKATTDLREEFLAIAYHNLRTPVTQLKGYQEILNDPKLEGDERQRIIGRIGTSIEHIGRLIERILSVLTLEVQKSAGHFSKVDIREIIQSLLDDYGHRARDKNVELSGDLPSQSIQTLGDRKNLYHAFEQFIDNAIKYTDAQGKIRVRLSDHKSSITVEVIDTGEGMPEEEMEHLFQQFRRLHAFTPSVEGEGLGLYIAKLIIDQHGGRIDVESKVREGSRFIITLPKVTSRGFFDTIV